MIGNKTLCDICSSKAMRKARLKKDKDSPTTASTDSPTENLDELAATPAPPAQTTQHHHGAHDEGIFRLLIFRLTAFIIILYFFFILVSPNIFNKTKKNVIFKKIDNFLCQQSRKKNK